MANSTETRMRMQVSPAVYSHDRNTCYHEKFVSAHQHVLGTLGTGSQHSCASKNFSICTQVCLGGYMLAAVIVLLPRGLLPMLKVFTCVVHYFYHLPYNMHGTTQAIHQLVSKSFQKVSYLYISFKNVYAFAIYLGNLPLFLAI